MSDLVVVCGSRYKHADRALKKRVQSAIWETLCSLPEGVTIMTGGASGVDSWAHRAASLQGFRCEIMHAEWWRDPKHAGTARNKKMLDRKPKLVIAFWDGESPGTGHMIGESDRRGITVQIHTIKR